MLFGSLHSGRRFWLKFWRKWMPIDEIAFAVSCSATVSDELELQLTKTDDKARNWMTMFQNWSTKDEIETSNRTFQSVRDETENTFSKIEWRGDENGRELKPRYYSIIPYIWETNLSEKIWVKNFENLKKFKWKKNECQLIDEIDFAVLCSTKLKLKRTFAHSRVSGTKLKAHF